jgi:hypothetical protein
MVQRIKNKKIDGVEIVEFNDTDIVRHRLTSYFIDIFKEEEKPIEKSIKTIEKKPKKEKNFTGIIGLIRNFFIK